MNKWKLLPGMAVRGVIQNGNVSYPYIMAGIFSAFTFFVFSSILCNDLMATLPKSAYAWMMLSIGRVLLGVILMPFLYYANSFLIKRRAREFGLYSILGMEKRHIGTVLFGETLIIYVIVTGGGILLGIVLSKLLFLLLLKLSGLPLEVEFVFKWQAFRETLLFFLAVFAVNLVYGLVQVGKSRPVELLSGSRKGERRPKWCLFYGVLGMLLLAAGYEISITSKLDSMIFTDFLLAVFLVVAATYFLFTSGSILFLSGLKRKKKFYYRAENFVTISGMLYRMKKNAASLANICIFSTMVIITLVCTLTLYLGLTEMTRFEYPYDVTADYNAEAASGGIFPETVSYAEIESKVTELAGKYGIRPERIDVYDFMRLSACREGNRFIPEFPQAGFESRYGVILLMLEDYNRLEGKNKTLEEGQVLLFSSGKDLGFSEIEFMGLSLEVREEVDHLFPYPKSGRSDFDEKYVIVVKNKAARDLCARAYGVANGVTDLEAFVNSGSRKAGVLLDGEDGEKSAFVDELLEWFQMQQSYSSCNDGLRNRAEMESMYGGLLFIGILFGLIFFMCLLLIMYYKQISEGYEDQGSFAIMQKVGMSDREIRGTVRRQILLVFFIPLGGAIAHTIAGLFMTVNLMAAVGMYNSGLMVRSAVAVSLIFVLVYGISYLTTARTYYRIVR